MRALLLAALLAAPAAAQTGPSGTTYGYTKIDLSQTGSNLNPLKVNGTITAVQGNPPWRVTLDTGSVTSFQGGTWSVQALQSGAWHITIDTGAITANVSGSSVTAYAPGGAALALDSTANSLFKAGQSIGNTTFGASQSGAWTVTANQGGAPWSFNQSGSFVVTPGTGTWPISAVSLPLPTGAATSANQATQITELVAIDSNTAAAFRAGQSIGNTTFGASQSGAWTVTANQGGQWLVATSSAASSVQASQLGAWTVTSNQGGAWHVSVDTGSITAFQGGSPWSVNGSTVNVKLWDGATNPITSTLVNGRQALDIHQADTSFVVSGLAAVGNAPTLNPISVSGIDGTGLKRHILTDIAGRISLSSGTTYLGQTGMSLNNATGTQQQVGYQVGGASVPVNVLATATPSDILPAAGTIGALGEATTVTGLHGVGSAIVSITGAWVGAINIQSSVDGVVWSTNSTSVPGVTAFSMNGITANGSFRIPVVGGFQRMRATFTSYTSGSATVQFYFAAPVPIPFVFQSIAANLNAQVVGAQAVGNSVATSSPVVVGGADSSNNVQKLYTDANGSTREAKDVGRQVVIASATAVTGTVADTIFTLTVSTAFTNGTSGTSFGIPSGKTFRIQSLTCVWRSTALLNGSGTCRLRVASSGACTVSSPVAAISGAGNPVGGATLVANLAVADHAIIPDGLELSGTQTFCVSHLDSAAANVDVTLMGYQY